MGTKFSKELFRGKTSKFSDKGLKKLPNINESDTQHENQNIFQQANLVQHSSYLPSTQDLTKNPTLAKKIQKETLCYEYEDKFYMPNKNNVWFKFDKKPDNYTSVKVGIDSKNAKKFFVTREYYNVYLNIFNQVFTFSLKSHRFFV